MERWKISFIYDLFVDKTYFCHNENKKTIQEVYRLSKQTTEQDKKHLAQHEEKPKLADWKKLKTIELDPSQRFVCDAATGICGPAVQEKEGK